MSSPVTPQRELTDAQMLVRRTRTQKLGSYKAGAAIRAQVTARKIEAAIKAQREASRRPPA